ncbi:MAG: metallophosphoesterase [Myxococcota bacterium]
MAARTIIVGDVHGCADELEDLFDAIGLTTDDRLVMVGDLVQRGPHPERVLHLVMEAGGQSVRGNHEDRLLRWLRHPRNQGFRDHELRRLDRELARTADRLDTSAWDFVKAMPLWLDLEEHGVRVVHAGVVPGQPIDAAPRRALLYMRSLDDDGNPRERRQEGQPWASRYRGPPHVVFGHDAVRGLQLHPWATGLDTGCVYGGRLSALVLKRGEPLAEGERRHEQIASVPARKRYVDPTRYRNRRSNRERRGRSH